MLAHDDTLAWRINHDSESNCILWHDDVSGRLYVGVMWRIEVGEQLFIDYGKKYWVALGEPPVWLPHTRDLRLQDSLVAQFEPRAACVLGSVGNPPGQDPAQGGSKLQHQGEYLRIQGEVAQLPHV
eukprot:SAG31_NODE_627_length_13445_cov_18.311053_1_plen_126_part_00